MKTILNKLFEKLSETDEDRHKIQLVRTTFTTIDGKEVTYDTWVKVNKYTRGIQSYNELELSQTAISIENESFNTKHIVKLQSEIFKEGRIKPEAIKKHWRYYDYKLNFNEDEIEVIQ